MPTASPQTFLKKTGNSLLIVGARLPNLKFQKWFDSFDGKSMFFACDKDCFVGLRKLPRNDESCLTNHVCVQRGNHIAWAIFLASS